MNKLDEFFEPIENSDYVVSEHRYRRKYPFSFEGLAVAEGYVKDRFKIVLCFEYVSGDTDAGVPQLHIFDVHYNAPCFGIDQLGFPNVEVSRRWQDALMLVADIKLAEFKELVLPSRVGLHLTADVVSDAYGRPVSASYMAVDGSLYRGPILSAEREGASVGCGVPIGFDQDTVSVIKGSHQIMHGITQRGGKMPGRLGVLNGTPIFQRSLLVLGEKSLLVVRDEAPQEGFHLTDVLIGPFYLEVGARKVEISSHMATNG